MPLDLFIATAQSAAPSPPSGPLGWLPYVIGAVIAWGTLKGMPANNARTVGESYGGLVDRLHTDNRRLVEENATLRARIVELEAELRARSAGA